MIYLLSKNLLPPILVHSKKMNTFIISQRIVPPSARRELKGALKCVVEDTNIESPLLKLDKGTINVNFKFTVDTKFQVSIRRVAMNASYLFTTYDVQLPIQPHSPPRINIYSIQHLNNPFCTRRLCLSWLCSLSLLYPF